MSTKTLKFASDLIPPVLSGEKTTTWRLWDDKDLRAGDQLLLLEFGQEKPFAKAIIIQVIEKTFADLADEDQVGHESFASDDKMLETYSRYYKKPVDKNTKLKIINFALIRD